MKKTWIYYGIFFSDNTKRSILEYAKRLIHEKFNNDIPENWKIYCDHMTLVFNNGTSEAQEDADFYEQWKLGLTESLMITDIGISNKAIAFKVRYFGRIANKIPHITIAVAPNAKPVNSNDIENWYKLDKCFYVSGKINKVVQSKNEIIMNENQNFKDIDLSKMSISQLKMCINSIYGDGSYMNTKEYWSLYNQMREELFRRLSKH